MYNRKRKFRGGYHGRQNQNRTRRIKTFDPRTIIGKENDTEEVKHTNIHTFSDFKINSLLLNNIQSHGFVTPTPIQDKTIPLILRGLDVVGIANTGTGKTAAFLLPLINKYLQNNHSRILVVAPTRELAIQIESELRLFTKGLPIHSVACIGGVSINGQIQKLNRRPQFVIGTPGRLIDLESQRKLNFADFNTIVLDEVDRMLDMGFIKSIEKIISKLPSSRQSLFFSATLDDNCKKVMNKFTQNPELVSVKTSDSNSNIRQEVIETKNRNKIDILTDLLDNNEFTKTLVFMRTKRSADKLQRSLTKIGFNVNVMHGNKSQNQRQRSLDQFRTGKVPILIATDVASRGIDVNDITHVINYDLPESYEDYIHRIGRTGRATKKGSAITLV